MLRLLTIGLIISSSVSFGWYSDKDTSKRIFSIVTGGFGYQYISPNSIGNSGLGVTGSIGFNMARPFTNKFSLAIYATIKSRELIPQANFNSSLSKYLIANSDLSNLSPYESIVASHFISQTEEKGTIGGAARRQAGLQLHLNKPYFPTIRVYTGKTIELIHHMP